MTPNKDEQKNQPNSVLKTDTKPAKVDGDGDMTNFLDAIGYYSPEEEEEKEAKS